MNCPTCGRDNAEAATFCGHCGNALHPELRCPACGKPNSSDLRFCTACGSGLTPASNSGSFSRSSPVGPLSSDSLSRSGPISLPTSGPTSFCSGRYIIQRMVGEGAKKRVYLARDTRLERDVAFALLKTDGLDAEGLVRVKREGQAMGRLGDHAHIVTVYDVGDEHGHPFIVSQYMEGGSVAELLAKSEDHRLPIEEAIRIAAQICDALEHAHAQGIVHRDLKPGNVWLTQDGTAMLGDFGLAIALDRSRLTTGGMMVGTAFYMPPEGALGRAPDARGDLYSLGAMLYEMVTGKPPFVGDDSVSIISQHLNTPPLAPSWHNPAVHPPLESLILQLLAKAPEERPRTSSAVRERLHVILTAPAEAPQAGPAAAPGVTRLATGRFVGREAELATLKAAIESTLSGQGSLVMIAGDTGLGKTRLAEEAGVYARLRGGQVLTGRCYEGEGAPDYWPWVQIIRTYVREHESQRVLSEMGPGAADIAQVVSEVREQLSTLPSRVAEDPEQARFRLFDSVANFLRNAGREQPLVLILDNLHGADRPSLLLLQFLGQELKRMRLLVIVTYRDTEVDRGHPLSGLLGSLWRESPYERIRLHGLSAVEVTEFMEAAAGHDLDDEARWLARALHRETEGNPFFIQEILRHLVETGRIYHRDGRWVSDAASPADLGIAEGVREVMLRRLERLSEDCNRVLTIASVIGREFSLDVLERATDLPGDRLLELLEEAASAHVVAESEDALGHYAFTHPLIRQTLYEEQRTAARVRLHRKIGEALESIYGDNVQSHLAELAHHFLEAAPAGDASKAVDLAVRAGTRATGRLAYEEAVDLFERAHAALSLRDSVDDRQRCEILLVLGDAQWRAGTVDESRKTFLRAAELARESDSSEHLAQAALGYGAGMGGYGFVDRADSNLIRLLEEALARTGKDDSVLRVRLLARLAIELYYTDFVDKRVELGREAVEMAQRLQDSEAQLIALYSQQVSLVGPSGQDERLKGADQIVRLAEQVGDRAMAYRGHHTRLITLLELGDIQGVDREIAACARLSEELREPLYAWQTATLRTMRLLFEGRFDEAAALADEALEIGQRGQSTLAFAAYGALKFEEYWAHGRIAEIEASVKGFAEQYSRGSWSSSLAYLYTLLEREEDAQAELNRVAKDDFADIPRDGGWLLSMFFLSLACWYVGDGERAQIIYDMVLPYRSLHVTVLGGTISLGSVSFALGALAATLAKWDEMTEHFDFAIAQDDAGCRPMAAQARYDYATALLRRAEPGDREKALGLLNEALNITRELGMRGPMERVLALKLKTQGVSSYDGSTSIHAVSMLVQKEPPNLLAHAAPDGTVTLLFSDIEGSTVMTEQLGDLRAQEVLRAHNLMVRQQVYACEGVVVKEVGDGFMSAFSSVRRALQCAVGLQQTFATHNEQNPEFPIRVRMGLHTGEAVRESEDFFGRNVILASRIADQAEGGQVLVSSLLKALIESSGDFRFDEGRELELKGLTGKHRVHALLWQ